MQSREALIEDVSSGLDYNYYGKQDATALATDTDTFVEIDDIKPSSVFGKLRQSIGSSFRRKNRIKTAGNATNDHSMEMDLGNIF